MNTEQSCCNNCETSSPPKEEQSAVQHTSLLQNTKFRFLLLGLLIVVPFEILSILSIHMPPWIELPLFLTLIIAFGHAVFLSGLQSIVKFNFSNINLLMTVAIIGAMYLGELEEAVIIVVLFSLGETLEKYGIQRSQQALRALIDKAPKSALLKATNEKVPIESVEVGSIVIIKPGDQIPLDGIVTEGSSLIDEAAITGEPLPKNKRIGDTVFAGTHNGQGYLEVRVTKIAKDTTLAKIIDLTYKSAEKKSQSQQFIESFSRYYTPAVMGIAVLIVVIPVVFLGKPFTPWFTQALTLLLISCPCALVISTPIAVFSAIGNATRKGVLVKGGKFIEEMGKLKAIAIDKTRTLTKGEAVVSDIVPFNGYTENDVLACAAGMEAFSEHPIALSILQKAKEKGLAHHPFQNFQAVAGKGLRGECTVCTDKHHCMGSLRFITEEHSTEEKVLQKVSEFENQGKTTIVMSDQKTVKGVIGVTDEIRPESKQLINELKALGIKPVMLTGDNKASAWFVAEKVGIEEVKAELLPDEKVKELSRLLEQYKYVAMVGDGVNDAPALATASVGIAMGAIGSDLAIENADIALMNNNLAVLPFLVKLGKKTVETVRFNVTAAVGVKLLFLVLAVTGWSSLALAIFADVGMTLLVVVNSLRLYRFTA